MEAKNVRRNKIFLILTFLLFIANNLFAQIKEEIYFLIDRNDTLIKKQIATKENLPEGYLIIAEARSKLLKTTPIEEGKIWIPESDEDNYIPGQWFQFFKQNDKLITEDELSKLDVIRKRTEFLKKDKISFDLSKKSYFFIEPQKCSNKYILRKVFPVIFE